MVSETWFDYKNSHPTVSRTTQLTVTKNLLDAHEANRNRLFTKQIWYLCCVRVFHARFQFHGKFARWNEATQIGLELLLSSHCTHHCLLRRSVEPFAASQIAGWGHSACTGRRFHVNVPSKAAPHHKRPLTHKPYFPRSATRLCHAGGHHPW